MPFAVTKEFRVNSMRVVPKTAPAAPQIPSSGLILNVDASNASSWPGSGATWYDLSPSGYNVTLIGTPTYTSQYGGGFSFDPSFSNRATATSNALGSTAGTVCFWIKSSVPSDIMNSHNGAWSQITAHIEFSNLLFRVSAGSQLPDVSVASSTIFDGTAHLLCFTWETSGERAIWKDSTKLASLTGTVTPGKSGTFEIGYKSWGAQYFNGTMYQIISYDRALSSSEMASVYNATKTRFP